MKVWLTLLVTILGTVASAADSREDIELVFDRHKGGLYAEYSKALKSHPKLAGKIVFDIDIARSGAVTGCRVKSSTLGNQDLERRLCDRIGLMKFKPRTEAITVPKIVSFFPAA